MIVHEKAEIIVEEKPVPLLQVKESISIVEEARVSHKSFSDQGRVKKELPKQSALGAMMKEIHQEVVISKDESKIELTEEALFPLWKEFLEENKGKLQNAFLSVAEKQVPKLIGEVITFTETNNISLELLQLHKMDILSYIRKRTTSTTATLNFKLHRNESNQKNYKTPKDRLKEMVIENPSILKLIEKLDLNEY